VISTVPIIAVVPVIPVVPIVAAVAMITAVTVVFMVSVMTASKMAAAGTMIGVPFIRIAAPRTAGAGTKMARRPSRAGNQIARKYQDQKANEYFQHNSRLWQR
jgi:hypothetical protein